MIDIETLFFVVVARGKANAILKKAQECGAAGGTIFLGEGTAPSKLLDTLGLTEVQKEILMISSTNELSDKLHEVAKAEFSFTKRNKGIAFTIPFQQRKLKPGIQEEISVPDDTDIPDISPYSCIVTIVDKGRSKACINAARAAGANGGTIIHGRGAGIPTDFYFPLVIEPQKDIVMIITAKEKTSQICERIFSELELDRTGNGIVFTLPVSQATGLFENTNEESKEVLA